MLLVVTVSSQHVLPTTEMFRPSPVKSAATVSSRMVKSVTAAVSRDVETILAATRKRASSKTMRYAMTATKDAAITASSLQMAPCAVRLPARAIPQRHVQELQLLALLMKTRLMVRAAEAAVSSVPAASARVVINNVGMSWVAIRALATTHRRVIARLARFDAQAEGLLLLAITFASKSSKTS